MEGRWVLIGVVVAFAVFLLIKSRLGLVRRTPQQRAARQELQKLKSAIFEAKADAAKRASLWRRAAHVALDGLGRPYRAATYARRAEKLDPSSPEAIPLIAATFIRSRRYRALEKLLWRRLEATPDWGSDSAEQLVTELCRLYEGALRRPAQASALRRLWAQKGEMNVTQ